MLKTGSLWAILIIVFCLNIYGQEKEITRDEFFTARSNAFQKQSSYNRRVTIKAENFILNKTGTSVYEVIRPDKYRYLSIITENNISTRTESILIGNTLYTRVNDGEWTKTEKGESKVNYIGSVLIKQRYTVIADTLNNQTVQLFEESIVTESYSEKYKFWINAEGLILKSEETTEQIKTNKLLTRTVTEYEYNPQDLKIEAPIK